MALIELDRDPPPGIGAARPADRWRRVRLRPVALVLVCLLLTGLGAGQPLRQLAPIASFPDSGAQEFTLAGGILYQAEPDPAVPGRIAAYRLLDGQRLWSVALPVPVDMVVPAPVPVPVPADPADPVVPAPAGTAVVLVESAEATGRPVVAAVDPVTGRLLWHRPGDISALPTGGSRVVLGAFPGSVRLLAVDLRSGATVWQRSLGDDRVAVADNDRIVLAGPDGVAVLDAGTAQRLVTGDLPAGQQPLGLGADALYAVSARDRRQISAYDLVTLARRWSARLADPVDTVWSCGPMLCAGAGSVLLALDPGTGRVRWRDAAVPGARVDLGGRLVAPGSALGDAFTSTGRTSAVYRMRPAPVIERGPPLYTVDAGTVTLLVRLDPATARRDILAQLPAGLVSSRCQAAGGFLVCDTDGRYVAWRYPVG